VLGGFEVGAAGRRRTTPQRDGGAAQLAPFGPKLSAKASSTLDRLGVEQHMHSMVTQVDAIGLNVRAQDSTEERYAAGTVLWTAGVVAPPVAAATSAKQDRAGLAHQLAWPLRGCGVQEVQIPDDHANPFESRTTVKAGQQPRR
jgi:NADPH-dependent 2,4-dienoyl-CoA reductase/sulfur reductase-like enzyme